MIILIFAIFQYLNIIIFLDNYEFLTESFEKAPINKKIGKLFMFFLPSLVILSLCLRSL
jgi:hypothetical protein